VAKEKKTISKGVRITPTMDKRIEDALREQKVDFSEWAVDAFNNKLEGSVND
jgi:hypothetical protein